MATEKDNTTRNMWLLVLGLLLCGFLMNVTVKLTTGKWLQEGQAERDLDDTVEAAHELAKTRRGRDFDSGR